MAKQNAFAENPQGQRILRVIIIFVFVKAGGMGEINGYMGTIIETIYYEMRLKKR